jgi:hypothetical protein
MSNGYDILGKGTLDAFLLAPSEYTDASSHIQATNLCNIVQNPGKRVSILNRSSKPILNQFILKGHVLWEHLGLPLQIYHRLCGYRDRPEGVLQQLEVV